MLNEETLQKIDDTALSLAKQHVSRYSPYYNQIPDGLMKDGKILWEAKGLFGLLHSYSPEKDLTKYPKAEVSMQVMESNTGCSRTTIWRWTKHLKEKGWIEIIKQGKNRPNLYILYPVSKSTFNGLIGIKRVQLKINSDHELMKRLKGSLYK